MGEFAIDPILSLPRVSLKDVHTIFKKWIYLEDTHRIDVALAIRLIAKITGTRVWMIFVGPSGDWKSELLNAIIDDGKETKVIRNFTSKTLVNGNPNVADLAPKLHNKTIIIGDMAQLLKLHPNEKGEVWAQLRDLYDGFAGKQSGMGKDVEYKDLNVTLMAASTPAIDSQILIHQDLGTRELIYRSEKIEKTKLMDKVWENEKVEDIMKYELREVIQKFLASHEYDKDTKISEKAVFQIKYLANKLSYFRAPAESDRYTGDLINDVHPERPTRVLKQLKRLYIGLKSLDPDYEDDEVINVLKKIIKGSAFKIRNDVLEFLIKENDSWIHGQIQIKLQPS